MKTITPDLLDKTREGGRACLRQAILLCPDGNDLGNFCRQAANEAAKVAVAEGYPVTKAAQIAAAFLEGVNEEALRVGYRIIWGNA